MDGESSESVARREAETTAGLWLPIAFARIVQALQGAFGGKPQRTSEILRGFCLPNLSTAVESEEAKADEESIVAGFEALKRRFAQNG